MPLQPAVLGTARLKNFRLHYLSTELVRVRATRVGIWLSGTRIDHQVRVGSLQISDVLNDTPNTCRFLLLETTPPKPNQTLVVTLNSDVPLVLFSGTLQTVAVSYIGKPHTVSWDCAAIDDTALANRRRPFGTWTAISATDLAIVLIQTYAPDLSTAGIEAGLPLVDVILDGSEGISGTFAQLANLIGGFFRFDDGVAYLFTELETDPCDPIDADHPFLHTPPIAASQDVSQLRTRVYGKGHAEATIADVAAGETILPIADAGMFAPIGGEALAITQRLTYTGLDLGGAGGLVGPGVAPSSALVLTAVAGTGLAVGIYQYAYTWVTPAGMTVPGPVSSVQTAGAMAVVPPSAAPSPSQSEYHYSNAGHTLTPGSTYTYGFTFVTAYGETALSPISAGIVADANFGVNVDVTYQGLSQSNGHEGILSANYYRSKDGGPFHRFTSASGSFPSPVYDLYLSDTDIAGNPSPPAVGTAGFPAYCQVAIAGVAIGPPAVTSRIVYRTAVGGSQIKLQQTLVNNTVTTGVQDATPDGSLGGNAPISDTSGVTATNGQITAGATSIPTAGAFARAGGGWIDVPGSDAVRYTGVTGNLLTGIPASGPGALINTIPYGTNVVAVPILTGVTGITAPIARGTPINLWVTRNDAGAQSEQSAIDALNHRVRADGIYEAPIIVDERRGLVSLSALCDATLALFAKPIQTVRYATRDVKSKSGKPVTVNLASPPITADLVIQSVQISEIDIAPGLAPRFEVTASSTRFSLDSLLRKLTKALGV